MLYATVRQRKIHVKNPVTVIRNGVGVDELILDMDQEWEAMTSIVCVFTNGSVAKEKLHTYGQPILVPWECLAETGRLSVSCTGYVDGEKVMTTMLPDSFWDVVQNGPVTGDTPMEPTPTLYEQVLAAAGAASSAAAAAAAVVQELSPFLSETQWPGIDLGITGAAAGQLARIAEVDEAGAPVKWESGEPEFVRQEQGEENSGTLLYVGRTGMVEGLKTGNGIVLSERAGRNMVHGQWEPGAYDDRGVWLSGPSNGGNIGIHRRFSVKPDTCYTVSTAAVLPVTFSALYVAQFGEDGTYLSTLRYAALFHSKTTGSFTTGAGTAEIGIYIYGEGGTRCSDYVPEELMIQEGSVPSAYEPYRPAYWLDLDSNALLRMTDTARRREAGLTVPAYYLVNDYLAGKAARIRQLLENCAGTGTAFFFVTDQHWELNAGRSPALIHYVTERVPVPRLFSGGDTGEGGSAEYGMALRAAFDGKIHCIMGNHEYFGTMNGDKLACHWDLGKPEQVGNTKRHFYCVEDGQMRICYVILCAYDNGSGSLGSAYDEIQAEWLRQVLNRPGWTAVVFTHSLYYGFGPSAGLVPSPDGAERIIAALDGAACHVACVLQGHAHLDRICHTPGGIPVITTTCDKYLPWIHQGEDMEPWLADRVRGTVTEQALEAVVLDTAQRTVHCVRIGAPADNWTDGVSTGTAEERIVTY